MAAREWRKGREKVAVRGPIRPTDKREVERPALEVISWIDGLAEPACQGGGTHPRSVFARGQPTRRREPTGKRVRGR